MNSLPLTGKGVIVDLGTGDGRFAYQSAKENPDKFYIGIDASAGALVKLSEKIHRKPAKGGLKNLLFVQAPVEDLPSELDGIADEIHIHFPWGSLLGAITAGAEPVLRGIRRICAAGALLEVIIGLDPARDTSELERLNVTIPDQIYLETHLKHQYLSCNLEIMEYGQFAPGAWPNICTSWAQKLRFADKRVLTYWIAQAV